MLLSNIKLTPSKILIQPTQEASSSFSTETKKYDRKAIAVIKGISEHPSIYVEKLRVNDKIIYDDSHSIDFTLDGVSLSIISPEDIVAIIEEDK